MIDEARIDTDERGFTLTLTGDFVDEVTRYIYDRDATSITLRLNQDAALELLGAAEGQIGPWRAERDAAFRDWRRDSDPADGYEDDPKHPLYHERMAAVGDLARKRARGE